MPARARKGYRRYFFKRKKACKFCVEKILLRLERIVAALVLTAANWASGHYEDAEGGWVSGDSSTFITDVEAGINTVLSNTGHWPNVLVVDYTTYTKIRQDNLVLDRIKHTQKGVITADLVASLFDLDRVLVGSAVYSSAEETAAGDDFTAVKIWETNAGKGSAVIEYWSGDDTHG